MASTRKRLEALTAGLAVPPSDLAVKPGAIAASPADQVNESRPPPPAVETRFPPAGNKLGLPKTGPGQMLAFRGHALQVESELASLKQRLAEFEGTLPTKKLDPSKIHPSKWANRHEASFSRAEFLRLKADIEHAGGNIQPILVRPLPGQGAGYELVFGHRRHRACQELHIPVLASIWTDDLPDDALFAAMDRENRERADLSNYEQGKMYQRALEEHLFPTQRKLAESLGVSHTWVRKALMVAQLPEAIVECFRSPLEITFRHAEQLHNALDKDRRGVLKRAEKVRGRALAPGQVVERLTDPPAKIESSRVDVRVHEQTVGWASKAKSGEITITLTHQISQQSADEVDAAVVEALGILRS